MKIWINKNENEMPDTSYDSAYIFSLNREEYSTIYSNISDTWLRLGSLSISTIYEDLFLIAISIFAVDKRVSRSIFTDCWTREFDISIPVIELEKWESARILWNKTMNFLTGDVWNINFRKSENRYSQRVRQSRNRIDISECDVVSLFSGGLDSFCGAIELLEHGKSPCFFGHNEYPKLRAKQEKLCEQLQNEYSSQTTKFLSFTANSRAPYSNKLGRLARSENTSRGRSLLFLCSALTIAGILGEQTPVYIPENGFIGLNVPLTNSRKGTCSTRTTHPFFLDNFRKILEKVGIQNPIINFYAFATKREIVNSVKDKNSFKQGYADTISCSHPCLPRWDKNGNNEYPKNCGYCYPCLIRKSSLIDITNNHEPYSYESVSMDFLNKFAESDKTSDLTAVISSIYRYKTVDDNEIKRLIRCTGQLSNDEIEKFLQVYKDTMEDLIELFSTDEKLKAYVGIQ